MSPCPLSRETALKVGLARLGISVDAPESIAQILLGSTFMILGWHAVRMDTYKRPEGGQRGPAVRAAQRSSGHQPAPAATRRRLG